MEKQLQIHVFWRPLMWHDSAITVAAWTNAVAGHNYWPGSSARQAMICTRTNGHFLGLIVFRGCCSINTQRATGMEGCHHVNTALTSQARNINTGWRQKLQHTDANVHLSVICRDLMAAQSGESYVRSAELQHVTWIAEDAKYTSSARAQNQVTLKKLGWTQQSECGVPHCDDALWKHCNTAHFFRWHITQNIIIISCKNQNTQSDSQSHSDFESYVHGWDVHC